MLGVAATLDEVRPLLSGTQAASFEVLLPDGSAFSFDADALKSPAILVFYRGGWCPFCNRQLAGLRTINDDLVEMGYDLYFLLPAPSVFIMDVEGMIQFQYTNPNYRIRLDHEVLLAAIRVAL